MAKLRHIAITVPDPWKAAEFHMQAFGLKLHYKSEEAAGVRGRGFVGLHHFGFLVDDVAATRKAIEAAGGTHWMGEAQDGTGFYEVKFHDPDGIVVDITANGWTLAAKD
jgi:predicted enzyme related to lactoylglutathione lyase